MPYQILDLQNGDVFQLTAFCQFGEQVAVNVTHHWCTFTDTSNLDMQDLVDDYEVTFRALYPLVMATGASFRGMSLRRILPVKSATFYSLHTGTPAAAGTVPLPRQLAGLIKLTANTSGRRGRGRIYIPFLPVEANASGELNADYKTAIQDIADAYITTRDHADVDAIHTNQFRLAIAHRNDVGVIAGAPSLVTGATAQGKIATQRRRGSYGKANSLPW